jgi:pyrroloquinoline quinone (PQQ) biosynthesis protein C
MNLVQQTAASRHAFIDRPLIQEVLGSGASKDLYLDFLGQAYHHVKCTAPLLELAAARCGADDRPYQAALFEYVKEEYGHDEWILEDIEALGGDPEASRRSLPRFPCKVMVGHAYYLIDRVSPYALLGMIHVLEGMSVALASRAVERLRKTISGSTDAGFKYLTTHSDLDIEHIKFFEELICTIDPRHLPVVIDSACDFYRLYGAIFQDLDARRTPNTNGSLSNDLTRA